MSLTRGRYCPAVTDTGIVKFHQQSPAIIESTAHFPVVVSSPSSAILNQSTPVQLAVLASSTYMLCQLSHPNDTKGRIWNQVVKAIEIVSITFAR